MTAIADDGASRFDGRFTPESGPNPGTVARAAVELPHRPTRLRGMMKRAARMMSAAEAEITRRQSAGQKVDGSLLVGWASAARVWSELHARHETEGGDDAAWRAQVQARIDRLARQPVRGRR